MNHEDALNEAVVEAKNLCSRVNKVMEERGVGLRDACIWIARHEPELFKEEAPQVLDRLLRSKIFDL